MRADDDEVARQRLGGIENLSGGAALAEDVVEPDVGAGFGRGELLDRRQQGLTLLGTEVRRRYDPASRRIRGQRDDRRDVHERDGRVIPLRDGHGVVEGSS